MILVRLLKEVFYLKKSIQKLNVGTFVKKLEND